MLSGIGRAVALVALGLAASILLAKALNLFPNLGPDSTSSPNSQSGRARLTSHRPPLNSNDERLWLDDQRRIYWIDDHRILFSSFRDTELQQIRSGGLTPEGQFRAPRVIRILDLDSGEVVDHALMAQGPFCYSKENILYQQWAEGTPSKGLLWGPLGKEKEIAGAGGFTTRIRCSDDQTFSYKYPNHMVALLEEHGMVEVQHSGKGQEGQLWLRSPNSTSPILIEGYMPVDAHSLQNDEHTYERWKGAYFITRTGKPYEAWWLFPTGKTEHIQIPSGPWDQIRNPKHVRFTVTQAGLLVSTSCSIGLTCHKWYLVRGDLLSANPKFLRPTQLDLGLSYHSVVSPDGCRLATTHGATGLGMKIPPKLKVIELCNDKTP